MVALEDKTGPIRYIEYPHDGASEDLNARRTENAPRARLLIRFSVY